MQSKQSPPPSQYAPPEPPVIKQTVEATGGSVIQGVTQILQVFWGDEAREALRNRQRMIEYVKKIWVQDILEASIPRQMELELQVEYHAELVEKPWEALRPLNGNTYAKLNKTDVFEAYEKTGGNLLILGEAGAGKTTILLQLARCVLEVAQEDSQRPIPVVFHLSSWSHKSAQFERWLIEELCVRYYIPQRVARRWVEKDELLFLLDGLDEVKTEYRASCVTAINTFRQKHGNTSIIVCCRTQDYYELPTRLLLQSAVILQPPTDFQVEQILGSERKIGESGVALQAFMQSPLNLEIMRRVVNNNTAFDLTTASLTPEDNQKHLWATYVQAMLERPRMSKLPVAQTKTLLSTLSWVANQMETQGQALFYLEQIQPSWLSRRQYQLAYATGIRLLIGLLLGATTSLIFILAESPNIALPLGLITAGSAVSASLLTYRTPYWLPIISACLITTLLSHHYFDWSGAILIGLLFGTMTGLAGISVDNISVAERLQWSWQRTTLMLLGLFLMAVLLGLSLALKLDLTRWGYTMVQIVLNSTPIVLAFIMALIRSRKIDMNISPNQGFRRSAQNALLVGATVISTSLLCGIMIGALDNKLGGLPILTGKGLVSGLRFGALIGLVIGLSSALYVGGTACLQHLVLRLVMVIYRIIPWNLVEVLDLANERVLLQKAGGGYLFIHRQLMEYFILLSQGEKHGS